MRGIGMLQIKDRSMLLAFSLFRAWQHAVIAIQPCQQLVIMGGDRKHAVFKPDLDQLLDPSPGEDVLFILASCSEKRMDKLRLCVFPAHAERGGPFQRKQAASLHEQLPDRAACLVPTGIQALCNHNFGCDELCSAYQSAVRKVVARKNVHIYALMGTAVLRVELLYAGRVVPPQLGVWHRPMRTVFLLNKIQRLVKIAGCFLKKTRILSARHDNIYIVIPWDKAMVPDRTQCSARKELIGDPVLSANRINVLQHFEQKRLMGGHPCTLFRYSHMYGLLCAGMFRT